MYSGERQIVNMGPSGPLRDYRSPELAGRNAGLDYAQMAQFLDNFTKTAKPLYDGYIAQQVAQEKAKIMAQPEMLDAYRRGDEQAKAFIGSLRPQTRDFVNQSVADAATEQWKRTFATLIARDPVLTGAPPQGQTEEEFARVRALRFKDLQEQASRASEFDKVDPIFQGTKIPELQQAIAAGKAFSYQKQAEALDKLDDDRNAKGFGANLAGLTEARQKAASSNRWSDWEQGRDQWWTSTSEQWQETRTPQQIHQNVWQGFTAKYNELLSGGELADVDNAESLMATMTSLAQSPVKMRSGQTLGEMTFEDGSTMISRLAELRLKIRPMREKLEEERNWKTVMPLFQQAMQPGASDAVRAQAAAQLPAVFSDPRQMMQAYSMLNQASSIADQPTASQQQTMALLQMELNKEGMTYDTKKNLVLNAPGLTWEQRLKFAPQVQAEPNQEARSIASGRQYNSLEIEKAGETISRAMAIAKAEGRLNRGVAIEDPDVAARNAAITATRMTEQRVQQLKEQGKAPSSDQVAAIYRNELDAYTRSMVQRLGAARPDKPATFAQVVTGELDYVGQRLRQNGGKATIDVFPPAVRERAAQQGYPQTYAGVQRYFLNRMKAATEEDGKGGERLVFPDPQKAYRDTVKTVRGADQSTLAPEQRQSSTMSLVSNYMTTSPAGVLLQKTGESLQWLTQKLGLADRVKQQQQSAAPRPQSPVRSQQVAARPQQPQQQNIGEQLIGGALNLLVGAAPAAAGEMPRPAGRRQGQPAPQAIGLENIPILAELMRLPGAAARTFGISTPVLPQSTWSVPVKPAPLAISNDMHPLFVAIGINEGTRTPNGGYTKAYYGHRDPGNGAWNVGTVSGQQGGSPQTSDQRWAGRLTSKAMAVAPILERLGLPKNSAGFQRVLFNVLDLEVQAPAAVSDFIRKLPQVVKQGVTIEAIAKARADSFINPATGQLEAGGFGNNYSRLLRDQRARAGTWDYKRRI